MKIKITKTRTKNLKMYKKIIYYYKIIILNKLEAIIRKTISTLIKLNLNKTL